jgi:hypothetical protein
LRPSRGDQSASSVLDFVARAMACYAARHGVRMLRLRHEFRLLMQQPVLSNSDTPKNARFPPPRTLKNRT